MARCDEFSLRLPRDEVLLEGYAGVAVKDRTGATYESIAFLEDRRDPRNFEPTLLALSNAPAEHREGFAEKCADEMRLEPTRLCSLHLLTDFANGMWVHAFRRELTLG